MPQTLENNVPQTQNMERIRGINRRIYARIGELAAAHKAEILAALDHFRELLRIVLNDFAPAPSIEGRENIPMQGRIVIASNHPFSSIDLLTLIRDSAETHVDRPWAVIGQLRLLAEYCPNVLADPHFASRFIQVRRNRNGAVTNGMEIIRSAVRFLKRDGNATLFIAPANPQDVRFEPPTAIYPPHRGFAMAARLAEAQIVPALVAGSVDVDALRFDIKCRILEPFAPFCSDEETCEQWQERMREALGGMPD